MAVCQRQQHHLHRSEPERQRTTVVLDEDAEEALDRTEDGTMEHPGAFLSVVCRAIRKIKALREVEIDLHGRALPRAPDRILHLDVDLGTIERAVAFVDLVIEVVLLGRPP